MSCNISAILFSILTYMYCWGLHHLALLFDRYLKMFFLSSLILNYFMSFVKRCCINFLVALPLSMLHSLIILCLSGCLAACLFDRGHGTGQSHYLCLRPFTVVFHFSAVLMPVFNGRCGVIV